MNCPSCGLAIDAPAAERCPGCGAELAGKPRVSVHAVLAVVTGLCLLPLVPSLFGTMALSEIHESHGARTGRLAARLGVALGLLWFLAAAAALYAWIRPETFYPRFFPERIARQQDEAAKALLTLAAQEISFKDYDHDRNDVRDFWVDDVAGLYAFPMRNSGHPELVLLDIARADASPATDHQDQFEPRDGYVFRAVPGVDRRVQFAYTAYPHVYGVGGVMTYYVDERHDVWEKDLGGMPADRHYEDPAADGWRRRY
ncbi:MAG: DUF2950 family protein [Planctomycetes bacterium]|nr:DUF2950 family protein [Planctomycetota bacterium]